MISDFSMNPENLEGEVFSREVENLLLTNTFVKLFKCTFEVINFIKQKTFVVLNAIICIFSSIIVGIINQLLLSSILVLKNEINIEMFELTNFSA